MSDEEAETAQIWFRVSGAVNGGFWLPAGFRTFEDLWQNIEVNYRVKLDYKETEWRFGASDDDREPKFDSETEFTLLRMSSRSDVDGAFLDLRDYINEGRLLQWTVTDTTGASQRHWAWPDLNYWD